MATSLQTSLLTQHLDVIAKNFNHLKDSFPRLYLAAEQLNDLFDQMFTEQVSPIDDRLWQFEAIRMLFGCFTSWSHSFIMTAAGLGEHGMTSARRAIEFACYISKIKESDERAQLWVDRRENQENKRRFSRQFAIPRCYFTGEYTHLKSLIVWHDHASDFGAHGNFATLATKWRENKTGSTIMSLQDDPKGVPLSTGVSLQLGSFILDALMFDLRPIMKDYNTFEGRVDLFREMLRNAKTESAIYEYKDKLTSEFIRAIVKYDRSPLEEQYEELRKVYSTS